MATDKLLESIALTGVHMSRYVRSSEGTGTLWIPVAGAKDQGTHVILGPAVDAKNARGVHFGAQDDFPTQDLIVLSYSGIEGAARLVRAVVQAEAERPSPVSPGLPSSFGEVAQEVLFYDYPLDVRDGRLVRGHDGREYKLFDEDLAFRLQNTYSHQSQISY